MDGTGYGNLVQGVGKPSPGIRSTSDLAYNERAGEPF